MDGVSRGMALVWAALEGHEARGEWATVRQVACATGLAQVTAWFRLQELTLEGLAERVRLGTPCYYRLARQAPGRRDFEARVRDTEAVLNLAPAGCPKRRRAS